MIALVERPTRPRPDVSAGPADDDLLLSGAVVRFRSGHVGIGGHRDDARSHAARWGGLGRWTAAQVRQAHRWVADLGLTGRGGAHFPVAAKWAPAIAAGPGGVVVVNAAEGEPAAGKDAALVQLRPHLVLDGAALAAAVIGAREIVVWAPRQAPASLASLTDAIAERAMQGSDGVAIRLMTAPGTYVDGEASSVIAAVRGGAPVPQFVADPARPWGDGPAVLVHNAETLARVAVIARSGGRHPVRSSLLTVATTGSPGQVLDRHVVEAPSSSTVGDAVAASGLRPTRGVLLGGYGGTWQRWEDIASLPASPEGLRRAGLSLGAGVVLLPPAGRTVMAEATAIMAYLADQSARQCGPCMFGLPAIAARLRAGDVGKVHDLLPLVEGRGACRHPDGAARMLRSAIAVSAALGEE